METVLIDGMVCRPDTNIFQIGMTTVNHHEKEQHYTWYPEIHPLHPPAGSVLSPVCSHHRLHGLYIFPSRQGDAHDAQHRFSRCRDCDGDLVLVDAVPARQRSQTEGLSRIKTFFSFC